MDWDTLLLNRQGGPQTLKRKYVINLILPFSGITVTMADKPREDDPGDIVRLGKAPQIWRVIGQVNHLQLGILGQWQ